LKRIITLSNDSARFTLRIDSEFLQRFHYIADYNARSANRKSEVLIKKHVAKFEKAYREAKLQQSVSTPELLAICGFIETLNFCRKMPM
jgi:hypothetical protein